MVYLDTSKPEVRQAHSEVIAAIDEEGLVYPVTLVEGRLLNDGVVSYPGVLNAVQSLVAEQRSA